MAYVKPLDLYTNFVNTLAGNIEIFLFGIAIVLAFVASKYRMPMFVFGMFLILFLGMLGVFYSDFAIVSILLIGVIIAVGISKIITR